jgi:hypothetical protein
MHEGEPEPDQSGPKFAAAFERELVNATDRFSR